MTDTVKYEAKVTDCGAAEQRNLRLEHGSLLAGGTPNPSSSSPATVPPTPRTAPEKTAFDSVKPGGGEAPTKNKGRATFVARLSSRF